MLIWLTGGGSVGAATETVAGGESWVGSGIRVAVSLGVLVASGNPCWQALKPRRKTNKMTIPGNLAGKCANFLIILTRINVH